LLQQQHQHVVGCRLLAQLITVLGIHVAPLRRQHPTRFLLLADLRNIGHAIGHHAEKHARQPDREYANRIEDNRLLKLRRVTRGQKEDQNVWKRDRRQWDKGVAEIIVRRNTFAREQPLRRGYLERL